MKNLTHYLFSLGLVNIIGFFFVNDLILSWIVIIFSPITSLCSLLPNYLDSNINPRFEEEGVIIKRRRHPLTHSPWSGMYFLPVLQFAAVVHNQILIILIFLLFLAWISHLMLDALNIGGLPLGKQSIYQNHPIKHYKFQWSNPQTIHRLRIAKIPYNDKKTNQRLSYLGFFLFTLNIIQSFLSI